MRCNILTPVAPPLWVAGACCAPRALCRGALSKAANGWQVLQAGRPPVRKRYAYRGLRKQPPGFALRSVLGVSLGPL